MARVPREVSSDSVRDGLHGVQHDRGDRTNRVEPVDHLTAPAGHRERRILDTARDGAHDDLVLLVLATRGGGPKRPVQLGRRGRGLVGRQDPAREDGKRPDEPGDDADHLPPAPRRRGGR